MIIKTRNYTGDKRGIVKEHISNYCESDIEKRKRIKQVNVITSHLISAFRIEAFNTQLIFVLSNSFKDSNYDALRCWVDCRLDSIGVNDYEAWNNRLEEYLNDIYV